METKLLNIINAVDDGAIRADIAKELSDPSFLIGSEFTVNKLINKMIAQGFIEENASYLSVTAKGRKLYNNIEIVDF